VHPLVLLLTRQAMPSSPVLHLKFAALSGRHPWQAGFSCSPTRMLQLTGLHGQLAS
jgi:hypothetical protein